MQNEVAFEMEAEEREVFHQDAKELLQAMETGILGLEQAADSDTLNSVFRAAHTLKAMAGVVGHHSMAELTHTMESLFDDMRNAKLAPSETLIDELLSTLDVLRAQCDEIITNQPSRVDVDAVLDRLRAMREESDGQDKGAAESVSTQRALSPEQLARAKGFRDEGHGILEVRVGISPGAVAPAARLLQAAMALMEEGQVIAQVPAQAALANNQQDGSLWALLATQSDATVIEEALGSVYDLAGVCVQPYSLAESAGASQTARTPVNKPSGEGLGGDTTIRIDVDRLDTLMNLVGELVTDRNSLAQIESGVRAQYGRDGIAVQLDLLSAHFGRIVDQLQEEVMGFRMLPIATLFDKFPRLVRDLARSQGKKVNLIIEGGATELDRSLIECVGDPLIHLLRNAVDHGVETSEERIAASKPATATVRLMAAHEEGHIVITVEDDGHGIDPMRVRQAAVKRGLYTEDQVAALSDDEAINLIFAPNLSTAEQVTEVSGRGVGMDVVRSNVERLNGTVVVDSEVGRGSTIRLALPLTLAIVQTMMVAVGSAVYAIPLTGILDSVYLSDAKVNTIRGRPTIWWRGLALPLLDLRRFFGQGLTDTMSQNGAKPAVVAVARGKVRLGLIVDRIIGKQETVVKSLGPVVGDVPGLSGCTIMGDGRIALIIDTPGLINLAMQARRREAT